MQRPQKVAIHSGAAQSANFVYLIIDRETKDCACVDAASGCTDADAVISKAANTVNGEMPGADEAAKTVGGRRLAVTAASRAIRSG